MHMVWFPNLIEGNCRISRFLAELLREIRAANVLQTE